MVVFETLDAAVAAIRAGQSVAVSGLLPILQRPEIEDRVIANLAIGRAFQAVGQHDRAHPYLDRARLLGGPRQRDMRLHWDALRRQERLHEAQAFLRECVVAAAHIRNFDWMGDALAGFQSLSWLPNLPRIDTIISASVMSALANEHQQLKIESASAELQKLRIGHVIIGETDPACRLYDIHMALSRLHDRETFDVSVFTLGSADEIKDKNPRFFSLIDEMHNDGVEVVFNQNGSSTFKKSENLAKNITKRSIDIAVYGGQGIEYFLTAAMRPAKIQAGIDFGDPQFYGSRALDFIFAWMKHFIMEAVTDAAPLPAVAYQKIRPTAVAPLERRSLGIGPEARIMASIGLPEKFQPSLFWDAVAMILEQEPNAEFVVIGISPNGAPGLNRLPPGLKRRIHAVGYQDEPNRYLPLADLYLDTIPLGGGYSVYDAIMRDVPCVLGEHSYERIFNLSENFGPMSELLGTAAHATPPDDAAAYAVHALRLLREPDHASRVAGEQKEAMSRYTDSRRMVWEMEETILSRLQRSREKANGSDEGKPHSG